VDKYDAQGRRYVYGDSVAINGGEMQPVSVRLGAKLWRRRRWMILADPA
jgi:hypothetical protein